MWRFVPCRPKPGARAAHRTDQEEPRMRPVFIDVDTQMDFLFPAGALYVPGSESVIPQIQRLNQHAISCGFPLVAPVDAHAEDDPEFKTWPPHCIKGTFGQRKA